MDLSAITCGHRTLKQCPCRIVWYQTRLIETKWRIYSGKALGQIERFCKGRDVSCRRRGGDHEQLRAHQLVTGEVFVRRSFELPTIRFAEPEVRAANCGVYLVCSTVRSWALASKKCAAVKARRGDCILQEDFEVTTPGPKLSRSFGIG